MPTPRRFALLTASCLLLACSGDDTSTAGSDTDQASTSTSTTGETTAMSTTTGDSDSDSGSMSDSASTSTTSGDTTTTTSTTSTTSTTGAETTTTTTGGVEFPICEDYCGHIAECYGDVYPECFSECDELNGLFSGIGPVCGEAMTGVIECSVELSCEDLGLYLNEMPNPCDGELAQISGEPPACALEEEPPAFCADFCAKAEACMIAEPSCLVDCTVSYGAGNFMDPACGAAVESYYSCLGALDCDNLGNPVTCLDEATDVEALCDF